MMYVEHVFLLQSTCTRVRDVRVYHRIRDTIIAISIIENYIDTFLNTILVSSIYHTKVFIYAIHTLFNKPDTHLIICVYYLIICNEI